MDRRNFLSWMSAGMIAAVADARASEASPPAGARHRYEVVVIGAGLAGLAAAQRLRAQGRDAIVLEARERIGGRIWTSTRWTDAPLDLGATWIHGVRGNPLTALAERLRAKRVMTSYDRSIAYGTAGMLLSEDELTAMARVRTRLSRALEAAQSRDPDVSIRRVADDLIAELDGSDDTRRRLEFLLSGEIEQEYAGSAHALSAHEYDAADAFPGDDAVFANGFRTLTDFLARDLRIATGRVVQRIDWSGKPVRVETRGEHGDESYLADRVLITLPLGVLKNDRVRFAPALPPEKRAVIAGLGMGVLNKCYLRFAEAFWPTDVDWIEYVSERPGEWTEWVSFMRTMKLPILLGFNAADRGREIEAWSDARIVDDAMRTLRRLYGPNAPAPIDVQITRWASDPFALGSYSFNPVGATPALRRALARPIDAKLFFAGEATESRYFGTAHGAYSSGLRAAKELSA